MSSLFGSIKRTARTGRLRTELMLVDREVRQRQQAFGVTLYDYLEPLSKNANFFSADDRLTQVLRPPMLEAQRETAVVYNKIRQLKERMKQAEVTRAAAFPTPAQNWKEKMVNAGKSTALAGAETKLKAEMVMLERELKGYKQNFGEALYPVLEELEDREGWLPTDREVRTIYDACRKDIEECRKRAKAKVDELETLGVSAKELQKERDEAATADHQNNSQAFSGGSSSSGGTDSYLAPPPASMAPPAAAPVIPASADPFASTPTSELPVANPVGFSSGNMPAVAFGTPAPPPAAAPPPIVPNNNNSMMNYNNSGYSAPGSTAGSSTSSTAGIGPIGGGVMAPMVGMGGSTTNVMGGGAGTGMFGNDDDDDGGFAMGGTAGMGTGTATFGGAPTPAGDPWAANDPFATIASSPAPPPQQPPQQAQNPNSNLFLY
eukprot:CAMPEP_0172473408 /NCGR_PEP_ID=MMETSP1065-20121228/68841_1 /TAXON_ID=265537 /ORGANISM="Amphiprora paludosa, Strain CCMP125" /LENGTH=433 /DNA_ID=CAMNT_0013231583 /DNA_START=124 /DNA_END=1425 /DNA_ORIENTATION=-